MTETMQAIFERITMAGSRALPFGKPWKVTINRASADQRKPAYWSTVYFDVGMLADQVKLTTANNLQNLQVTYGGQFTAHIEKDRT